MRIIFITWLSQTPYSLSSALAPFQSIANVWRIEDHCCSNWKIASNSIQLFLTDKWIGLQAVIVVVGRVWLVIKPVMLQVSTWTTNSSLVESTSQVVFSVFNFLGAWIWLTTASTGNKFHPVSDLISLKYLNLSNAEFGGQIPIGLSCLKTLVTLDLSTLCFPGSFFLGGYHPGTPTLQLENPNLLTHGS